MDLRKGRRYEFFFRLPSIKFSLMLLSLLSSLLLWNHFKLADFFIIKTVKVYGTVRTDRAEVQKLILPLVERGFFTVNVESIKDRLTQLPWIADIMVRRVWPDQVAVTIVEKSPLAKWNDANLLSAAGELFTPRSETIPAGLPLFRGPEGEQITMLSFYQAAADLFKSVGLKISFLELTPYHDWNIRLNNGILMRAGDQDVLTRVSHFVKVYPKIIATARTPDVDYIDLRYANGLAIRWKKNLPPSLVTAANLTG